MNSRHILVFRFSSLGDIAMTVPVVKLLLQQHPEVQITFASVAFVKPLFEDIDRLYFVAADICGKHKGIAGLYRLYRELSNDVQYAAIADLHNVLRTQILRVFFTGKKIAVIDKGRNEKRMLTRQQNKVLKPLPSTFQRYADVFAKLDLPVKLDIEKGIKSLKKTFVNNRGIGKEEGCKIVGIAPFARYEEKTYPQEKMQQVISLLLKQKHIKIALFGGKEDEPVLQQMAAGNNQIHVIAGALGFRDELAYIAQLDVMISMDSANMHLASLYGVPVVSIWGGTHPYLGFLGWGQSLENCVQINLNCRPSSVFGNKPCRNHLACMLGISPLSVADKVLQILQ